MNLNRTLLALGVLLALPFSSFAEESCAGRLKELSLKKTEATANLWSNVRNTAGSLRYETGEMLKAGEVEAARSKAPEDLCPAPCAAMRNPGFVLRTVPAKFLSGYDTEAICAKKKAATDAKPFQRNKHFRTLDELNDWFNDFSQGKGADGRALYDECDGNCSPQYRTEITPGKEGLDAKVSVVCGHARDKSDNNYELGLFAVWSCKAE